MSHNVQRFHPASLLSISVALIPRRLLDLFCPSTPTLASSSLPSPPSPPPSSPLDPSSIAGTENLMVSSPSEVVAGAQEGGRGEGRSLSDENENEVERSEATGAAARVVEEGSTTDLGPQRLPDDVIAWMVAFCSTQTLASLCLVNWRTLELASRVLYGKVIFRRHGSFDSVFCHRDPATTLRHLHPHLNLYNLTSVVLLVRPSSPFSLTRLRLPALPLDLINLTVHLPPNGLTGFSQLFSLLRPKNLFLVHPSVQHSNKFWFATERKSWEIMGGRSEREGDWVWRSRLERVVLRGCELVGGIGDRGDRGGTFFLLEPPPLPREPDAEEDVEPASSTSSSSLLHQRQDPKPLSLTYDLTSLAPLTIPFYSNLLLHLQHDGCLSLAALTSRPEAQPSLSSSPLPLTQTTPLEGGLLILVPRQKEKEWIERGLVSLSPEERERVRVEVVEVGQKGWWSAESSSVDGGGMIESPGGRGDGRGRWGW